MYANISSDRRSGERHIWKCVKGNAMRKKSRPNFLVKRLGENYGWVICAACLIVLFCNSGLNTTGFAAYQPYLIKLGGLTNTQSSTLIMIRTFSSLLGMMVVDKLIHKLEAKRVVTFGMILCACTFGLYGTATSYPGYCLAAAISGLAHGTGGMIPASVIITRWFNLHRATALGICMSATGLSSMIASPIITSVVETRGLKTCFYGETVFVVMMALLVWYLTYSNPECIDANPIGSVQVQSEKSYAAHPAAPLLMGIMIVALGFFGIPSNIMTNHFSVLYSAENYEPGSIALMVALLGGGLAAGKMLYGVVADHIGTIRASLIFYFLVIAGGLLCCMAGGGSVPVGIAASIILGVGLAVSSVSISIYAAGVSTGAQYAQTLTRFQLSFNLGALLFGRVPGMIADRTGSYVGAYQIMTAIVVVSTAVQLITYRKIQRDDRRWAQEKQQVC